MPSETRDEFFVALCNYDGRKNFGDNLHSFISFGVRHVDGNVTLIAAYGKSNILPRAYSNPIGWHAVVQNEYVTLSEDIQVRYKAWAITWQNYLDFIEHLKAMQRLNDHRLRNINPDEREDYRFKLWATVPAYDEAGNVNGVRKALITPTEEAQLSEDNPEYFLNPLTNTCRHTALRFVDMARGRQGKHGNGVSSFFFSSPPLSARFSKERLIMPVGFFVLPLPPDAFHLNDEQRTIAKALYRRLDKIIMLQENNPLTHDKFNGLKSLYQNITEMHEPAIDNVMKSITDWEHENKALINAHRNPGWHLFATATAQMFEELHARFSPEQTCSYSA